MLLPSPATPLSHILADLNAKNAPPGPTLIPSLDAYLFATAQRTESPSSPLNLGDVFEIQGPPTSGKTHLLYYLLITCILPLNVGGWGRAAILIDSDATFLAGRFASLLRTRLSRSPSLDPESLEPTLQECLQNLHIFRPTCSSQVTATIQHLPVYLADHLPTSAVGILAIDSMSAFYWPDRFISEQKRLSPSSKPSSPADHSLHHILSALVTFRKSHRSVIIMTNWGLTKPTNPHPAELPYKQHLHPFPSLFGSIPQPDQASMRSDPGLQLTHHITLASRASSLSARLGQSQGETEEKTEIIGSVRASRTLTVGKFTLYVDSKDVRPNLT